MEKENQIKRWANTCYIASKVLYGVACTLCLVFAILAVALSGTHAIKAFTVAETAILFGTLAFYAFGAIGLFWNVAEIFNSVKKEPKPFGERGIHYWRKAAVMLILIATVPAVVGTTLLRSICPASEMVFPVEVFGILAGVGMLIIMPLLGNGNQTEKSNN